MTVNRGRLAPLAICQVRPIGYEIDGCDLAQGWLTISDIDQPLPECTKILQVTGDGPRSQILRDQVGRELVQPASRGGGLPLLTYAQYQPPASGAYFLRITLEAHFELGTQSALCTVHICIIRGHQAG